MAYFKISEPNKPIKWIKDVDSANGTLTFQNSRDGAHFEDEGFFAESEMDYIKFHFKEKYPELEYVSIDSEWGDDEEIVAGEDAAVAWD
jgi:hypothetical protein